MKQFINMMKALFQTNTNLITVGFNSNNDLNVNLIHMQFW